MMPVDTIADSSANKQLLPFLKWAGGKRWFAARYLEMAPDEYSRFVEPFLGSGAMFFALQPRSAILSDVNGDLVDCFRAVRDAPEQISEQLFEHHYAHCEEHYYRTRSEKPVDPINRAAWFIYLNRTCWNGLYRVNKRNEFNVPIGTKTNVVLPSDDFVATSKLLQEADIRCQDFEVTIDAAGPGDFLFVDPPYTANHNFNGFLKYNDKIFSWVDQLRLSSAVKRVAQRGAQVLVTNANHSSIREIYADIGKLDVVDRASVLAASSAHRIPIKELVVRTWLNS